MTEDYKPEGYGQVMPYLIVDDPDKLIAFMKKVFEAKELERAVDAEGRIRHAACAIGDSVVELGGGKNPDFPPMRSALHIYVPDADKTYALALASGARSLYEPQDHEYGERSGGIEDPCGNQWYIATRTA